MRNRLGLASLVGLVAALGIGCASPSLKAPDGGPPRDLAEPDLASAAPVDASAADDLSSPAASADLAAASRDLAPPCGAVGQSCGGASCATGGYCYLGACLAAPTITAEAPDGNVAGVPCSDLDLAHLSPSYFQRVTIHGRPGATSYRYYRKTSCGVTMGMLVPNGAQPLDGSGSYVFTIENATPDPSCTNGNLGVYEEWAVVDGVESNHAFSRIFSSGCAMYSTCGAVSGACP